MKTHQDSIEVRTRGRGTTEISAAVAGVIRESGIRAGLCHVFVQHTSASLMICENADPTVRADLERFMADVAPDGDSRWRHRSEGPDDMPAHLRSLLTGVALTLPVVDGRAALGTWQGVYLWEHRCAPHRRRVIVTVQG